MGVGKRFQYGPVDESIPQEFEAYQRIVESFDTCHIRVEELFQRVEDDESQLSGFKQMLNISSADAWEQAETVVTDQSCRDSLDGEEATLASAEYRTRDSRVLPDTEYVELTVDPGVGGVSYQIAFKAVSDRSRAPFVGDWREVYDTEKKQYGWEKAASDY